MSFLEEVKGHLKKKSFLLLLVMKQPEQGSWPGHTHRGAPERAFTAVPVGRNAEKVSVGLLASVT